MHRFSLMVLINVISYFLLVLIFDICTYHLKPIATNIEDPLYCQILNTFFSVQLRLLYIPKFHSFRSWREQARTYGLDDFPISTSTTSWKIRRKCSRARTASGGWPSRSWRYAKICRVLQKRCCKKNLHMKLLYSYFLPNFDNFWKTHVASS